MSAIEEPGLVDVVTSDDRRRHYEATGQWDATTLAGLVRAHAVDVPDRTAVVDEAGARRHTYAELDADADRVAAWLVDRGVEPGDVVSVQLPNAYETVVVAVGTLRAGAVINPLLPNYREKELTYIFSTARPKVAFTPAVHRGFDHRLLAEAVAAGCGVPFEHVVVDADPAAAPTVLGAILRSGGSPSVPAAVRPAAAVSELIFTSGTEANPKAIMHTEQTTNFSARVAWEHLGMSPDDVVWMPSPVGHSTGFNYGLRFALVHGLTLVLQDQWDPEVAAALVDRERCSYTLAATTFLQDLVHVAQRSDIELPTMQRFGCGGAPVPADLVRAADERALRVLRLYGSTEALVVSWNTPETREAARADTDGVVLPEVEVRLVGDDGIERGVGEEGEIHVRGPNTCVGFFADPERTAATFTPDGFVRSGDLAVRDADGALTISGRKKEIIIRGGINITPREIEDLLVAFPEVERAAVVGLADERLGERMCACVVLEPGRVLDLGVVVERLRATGLATYKLPERLEVLDALPTTASGKIQKHEIVRMLTEGGRP